MFIMAAGSTDHEIGHQWWPMMVNTNETWYGFMDEGFNNWMNTLSAADRSGDRGGRGGGGRGGAANAPGAGTCPPPNPNANGNGFAGGGRGAGNGAPRSPLPRHRRPGWLCHRETAQASAPTPAMRWKRR